MLFSKPQTVACILLLCVSCNTQKEQKNYPSPAGYDLSKPARIVLPLELDEISGVSFYDKDTSIFAISDDRGAIFKIKPNISITKWKFSHGADYEDIARVDSTFFILQSNGDLYRVNYNGNIPAIKSFSFPQNNGNEFETLYYDSAAKKLILICKDCESDKKKQLTTFSFNPLTGTFSDSSYTIPVTKISELIKAEKTKFKPSAAAINPVTGDLFIVSSVNKLLVIADREGHAKEVYRLDPKLFKQPEGITFSTKGDLVISNEFAESGTADLLIFKYNR